MQLQVLNNRLNEANTELLLCTACSIQAIFLAFDTGKLVPLAEFYPKYFSAVELPMLLNKLAAYIFRYEIR